MVGADGGGAIRAVPVITIGVGVLMIGMLLIVAGRVRPSS
jgi:hypothetical protein